MEWEQLNTWLRSTILGIIVLSGIGSFATIVFVSIIKRLWKKGVFSDFVYYALKPLEPLFNRLIRKQIVRRATFECIKSNRLNLVVYSIMRIVSVATQAILFFLFLGMFLLSLLITDGLPLSIISYILLVICLWMLFGLITEGISFLHVDDHFFQRFELLSKVAENIYKEEYTSNIDSDELEKTVKQKILDFYQNPQKDVLED